MEQKQYIITKKIAKQGSRGVILIPRLLQDELKPSTVVRVTIDVIRKADDEVD